MSRPNIISPDRVRTMWRADMSMVEIAAELGCSPERVRQILRRLGEPGRVQPKTRTVRPKAPVRLALPSPVPAKASAALLEAIRLHHPERCGA